MYDLKKIAMQVAAVTAFLMGVNLPAAADFGDGGKWERGPYGMYWDENDWPEWTPMYWMEEMANELDDDDDAPWNRGPWGGSNTPWGGNSWVPDRFQSFDGVPFDDWYDDDNDWPEWTPMYWMEEFADAVDDDDDDDFYRYGGYPPAGMNPFGSGINMPGNRNPNMNPLTGQSDSNAQLDPRRLDQRMAARRFEQLPRYGANQRPAGRSSESSGAPNYGNAQPRNTQQRIQTARPVPRRQASQPQGAEPKPRQIYQQGYRRGYRAAEQSRGQQAQRQNTARSNAMMRPRYAYSQQSQRQDGRYAMPQQGMSQRPVSARLRSKQAGNGCFPGQASGDR